MFVAVMTPVKHYADFAAVIQILADKTPGLYPLKGLPATACRNSSSATKPYPGASTQSNITGRAVRRVMLGHDKK
jgi:hypothetical protein